ncbi:membrane protein [Stenotrophomonas maltophilia]|nr:membrane protein [Stenotrophomonas maltophilia]
MTLVMVVGKEDREHYFFDAASFYLRRGPVPTAVPLSQINSVTRTSDKIYGRYVWQVCFSKASGRKCVTFTNNLTLFNRDFLLFLEAVRKANPLATLDQAGLFF